MKIAYNQATTLPSSTLKDDLRFCEENDYDFIEIRIDKLKEYLINHTVGDLKHYFCHSKIKPLSFNAIESFTFQHETKFNLLKEDVRLVESIGKEIGCDMVVAVPSFDVGDRSWSEINQETQRCLNEFLSITNESQLRFAIEFVGYPHCSINTLDRAHEVVREMNDPRVGLVIDCFHLYAMNSNLSIIGELTKKELFLFHIDDAEDIPPGMIRDQHRVWPGEGVIDLERIIKAVKDIGFEGPASVELFRPEYWNIEPQECIRVAKMKTQDLLKELNI
ncbi:sugar phosphate isomerase/epimerase [Alkalihalophilus lindianensis]|uniref:Sugar phosphate isomerase/epimerase n=1 Tax=Alkalihalophilus lindianensis TaxID=1630542 RepID=A0ABU3X637_9BACI|nr:sugar phosphate isomerase/epimerase [Alkalihalophilus lindianensis]MDV2682889.1 sugar phosphate isomerase/epimerase [Alkalihalophilus lindianensis]